MAAKCRCPRLCHSLSWSCLCPPCRRRETCHRLCVFVLATGCSAFSVADRLAAKRLARGHLPLAPYKRHCPRTAASAGHSPDKMWLTVALACHNACTTSPACRWPCSEDVSSSPPLQVTCFCCGVSAAPSKPTVASTMRPLPVPQAKIVEQTWLSFALSERDDAVVSPPPQLTIKTQIHQHPKKSMYR